MLSHDLKHRLLHTLHIQQTLIEHCVLVKSSAGTCAALDCLYLLFSSGFVIVFFLLLLLLLRRLASVGIEASIRLTILSIDFVLSL